jgi:Na+-driven multidrug efflux pump
MSVLDDTESPGTIARALWRLGWPLAIMLQLGSFSEAISIYWLGDLLGPSALAIEATLRYVFSAGGWVLACAGVGVSALVARSVGARDGRGLSIIASGVALTIVMWGVVALAGVVLAGPICDALGSRDVSATDLRHYFIAGLCLALLGSLLLLALLGGASGAGWTRLTLTRSIADLVLTAALVPLAIRVLDLGAAGAPIAIGVAQIAIAVVVWRALVARREQWHLGGTPTRASVLDKKLWLQMIDYGLPAQLARVATLGTFAYLTHHVAHDGRDAVVAFGIAVLLMTIAFNLTSTVGRAGSILVGQLAGARANERIRHVVQVSLLGALVVAAVPVVAYMLAGGPLASIFTSSQAQIARADETLLVIVLAIPTAAISQVFLFTFIALKAARRAGLLGMIADGLAIVFVLAWPGDDRLQIASWAIVVSNGVRAMLFVGLWQLVVRPDVEH